MKRLLPVDERLFPANTRGAIVWFWIRYWLWFFALLPWMLVRQVALSTMQALGAIAMWNRRVELFEGSLRIVFMNNLPVLALTTVFGERFTAIRYKDVLIDPGPLFGRRHLQRWLKREGAGIHAIVATHSHEEHVGNAGTCCRTHRGASLRH